MHPSVYIETTIVSYLVARPSRDAVMAKRQRQTREWWENRSGEYSLMTSETVVRECMRGESVMVRARLAALAGLPVLMLDREIHTLAKALVARGPLPQQAESDAYHIALATVNRLDYLLTWDYRHIANAPMYPTIARLCREHGFDAPILCTPDTLLRR